MKSLNFDTDVLPPADRTAAFRSAASDFVVDPVGDVPFRARWALLALSDVNVISSEVSPLRYRRDRSMIERDARDRVAVHCYLEGGAEGRLDGQPMRVGAGGAMIWDLSRTIDCSSVGPSRLVIATLPRFMLDEIFATSSYSCALAPSPELALLMDHLRFLLSEPGRIPEAAAANLAYSVRDLLANAMFPVLSQGRTVADDTASPLLRRIVGAIDAHLETNLDTEALSRILGRSVEEIRACVQPAGGLHRLIERRRLLAGYRMLLDPDQALPVSEIAFRCGVGDATRFTHGFTAMFGSAPKEVRRRAQGDLPGWAGAYPVDRSYGSFLKRN